MAQMTSTRRKLAIATWAPPAEGNIFGKVTLDVTESLRYIEHIRETTGEKISVTHLVGKAAGNALKKTPTLNGKILFGRFVPFDCVNITYLIASDGDLAKCRIDDIDQKSVVEIAAELRESANKVRSGADTDFKTSMQAVKSRPMFVLRPMLRFTGWLSGALGVSIKALGVERHAFGSAVITSVGMLGFDEATRRSRRSRASRSCCSSGRSASSPPSWAARSSRAR